MRVCGAGRKGEIGKVRQGEARFFFSEEKKQKTFMFWGCGSIPAMAWNVGAAEKQKSFGTFLQKRTRLLF
jgi:hypothetical protein